MSKRWRWWAVAGLVAVLVAQGVLVTQGEGEAGAGVEAWCEGILGEVLEVHAGYVLTIPGYRLSAG